MDRFKLNNDGIILLEKPFIQARRPSPDALVPYEQFKRAFRTYQKLIEKEMTNVTQAASDLQSKASGLKSEDACQAIDGMVAKLQHLKRKIDAIKSEEETFSERTRARLEHLAEFADIPSAECDEYTRWSKIRLDRVLADFLLRQGYIKTVKDLAKDRDMEHFLDIELFVQAKKIEDSLLSHSCTECLAWCKENSSNLKKIKARDQPELTTSRLFARQSTLEFNLRVQEYIELVRVGKLKEAIQYARKHLTPWSATHLKEIQRAMGLLAFRPDTSSETYREVYSDARWAMLLEQFRVDNYALNNLTSQPSLKTSLQAGLCALKSLACFEAKSQNLNCPVCSVESFGALAQSLPNSHHVISCIVCPISGSIMNEDNEPLVLPNGYAYSSVALKEMASRNNGEVTCPRTGQTFLFKQAKKAFIV
ncbi:CTLH/CRA C-terminal to lish motif domain-containing protein [Polychytrium aggregatum]|uniref:CTLH/CRA C-terminal to lish motif domain-containing protein n=1 Tax=Polychytrium aggregatum TaxID=110093 RepID=UPI0022FE68F4|nr:CTLH/CRA C-terminal to lish motif domain-containing protein [Polychytrium aggregatum]KAI9207108.1 CTLH/CRA C-terminal to lish motif domain-containing protein [Polychytrium aggregatum]